MFTVTPTSSLIDEKAGPSGPVTPSETVTRIYRDGKSIHVGTWQDVEDIIESNKAEQKLSQPKDSSFRKIATIPNTILTQWLYEEHAKGNIGLTMFTEEFDKLIFRKLQDPDWRYLRTG